MSKLFSFYLFLLFTLPVFGQDPISKIDSIYRHCLSHPNDSIALDHLNTLINKNYNNHLDTIPFYTQEQKRLAEEWGLPILESRALNMLGVCTELSGNLDSAIVIYQQAVDIAQPTGDKRLLTDINNNLSIVYSSKGLYELSLEYALSALALAEANRDTSRIAMISNNIGLRYSELRNQDLAISYFLKAIDYNKQLDHTQKLGFNYSNLGKAYYTKADYTKAIEYYSKGLRVAKNHNDKFTQFISYSGVAYCHSKANTFDKAKLYRDSALMIARQMDNEYGIQGSNTLQAYIHQNKGEYSKAIEYLEDAIVWYKEAGYLNSVMDIQYALADSYRGLGQYDRAYEYLRQYAFAKDSTYLKERDLAMEQVSIYKEEKQKKEKQVLNQQIQLKEQDLSKQKTLRNTFIAIGFLLLLLALGLGNRFIYQRRISNKLSEKNEIIEKERARSENLLLNILPFEVAEELKNTGKSEAKDFEDVTVLFTDFIDFTTTSEKLSAQELVSEVNVCFRAFDKITDRYGIEKIKTIGDAYMAAGGLDQDSNNTPLNVVRAALDFQQFMHDRKMEREAEQKLAFEMRAGIHTGPVVAGIVGIKKFQYDIWGDTVNTAARMENMGEVGKVNITQSTYELLKNEDRLKFTYRGKVKVKGKGEMDMYFVGYSG